MKGIDIKKDPQFFMEQNPVKYKMPVQLSDDEMIRHVWDIEEIRELMNVRSYFVANDMRKMELDMLWVSDPEYAKTASLGSNWGWYVGIDEIKRYYLDEHLARRQEQLDAYCARHPDFENKPENFGAGCCNMHPMSTSIVRVADDGKTAKGIWYIIGQDTDYNPDGTATGMWSSDKVCADFVRQDDGTAGEARWKIWNLVISNDLYYEAGQKFDQPTYMEQGENLMELAFGQPTIAFLAHNSSYNWSDKWPPLPEPYATMMPENSYGPSGHPMFKGGSK